MDLNKLYKEYKKLISDKPIDFDKFNHFAIVHHSTGIEGSTLTKEETYLLLDENLTPKGKPIDHSLMALDHLEALKFTLELAKKQRDLSIKDIQNISSLVMKSTGSTISSIGGDYDSSKGEFRKNSVRVDSRMFIDAQKVPKRMQELVDYINSSMKSLNKNSLQEVYDLAFKAHFQMVSIHPFADGNGRTSRLLMNYIQAFNNKPLTIIFKEDKLDYFAALEAARKQENINIFLQFMKTQAEKFFIQEIKAFKPQKSKRIGKGLAFLF